MNPTHDPSMKRLFAVALAIAACMTAPDVSADTPTKPKRPTMCMQGHAVAGGGIAAYVCLDGKRPRVFTRYIEVSFVDSDGKPATYVLGWTAPLLRGSKGSYVAKGTPARRANPERM